MYLWCSADNLRVPGNDWGLGTSEDVRKLFGDQTTASDIHKDAFVVQQGNLLVTQVSTR